MPAISRIEWRSFRVEETTKFEVKVIWRDDGSFTLVADYKSADLPRVVQYGIRFMIRHNVKKLEIDGYPVEVWK